MNKIKKNIIYIIIILLSNFTLVNSAENKILFKLNNNIITSVDLLKLIGENSQQDITPHPFTKIKKPKGPKIEDIFIKAKQSKKKKSNSKV